MSRWQQMPTDYITCKNNMLMNSTGSPQIVLFDVAPMINTVWGSSKKISISDHPDVKISMPSSIKQKRLATKWLHNIGITVLQYIHAAMNGKSFLHTEAFE